MSRVHGPRCTWGRLASSRVHRCATAKDSYASRTSADRIEGRLDLVPKLRRRIQQSGATRRTSGVGRRPPFRHRPPCRAQAPEPAGNATSNSGRNAASCWGSSSTGSGPLGTSASSTGWPISGWQSLPASTMHSPTAWPASRSPPCCSTSIPMTVPAPAGDRVDNVRRLATGDLLRPLVSGPYRISIG